MSTTKIPNELLLDPHIGVGIVDTATSTKLSVSNTGIDVTGSVTADGLTIDGTATLQNILNISGTDPQIRTDTSDGSDNKTLYLGGGGIAYNWNRGAFIHLEGNEAGGDVGITAGSVSGGEIKFTTGTTARMVISSTGNVGIGLGSGTPNYPIHIEKSVSGDWIGKIKNTHATNGYGLLIHAGDDSTVSALSVGNYAGLGDYLVVKGDGNVGIGTSSLYGKTTIEHASGINNGLTLSVSDATANGNITGIQFSTTSVVSRPRAAIYAIAVDAQGSAGWGADLVFATRSAPDGSTIQTSDENMRITSAGNVAIGSSTAQDGQKLYVDGSVQVSGSFAKRNSNGSSQNIATISGIKNQYGNLSTNWTSELGLYTYGQERVHIDGAGNMGLGVTPESWHSSHTALDIGTYGALMSHGSVNAFYTMCNVYLDSGGWKYKNTDQATLLSQKDGAYYFDVAPSGTADSAISWTTAMTISNTGAVEILNFDAGGASMGIQTNPNTSSEPHVTTSVTSTADRDHYGFYSPNGRVGYIRTNGSSTSYVTSSDYRLKENVTPMSGSIDRLKELKPSRFNFIADADTTVDGFLAHEAQATVPECVSGTKDGMKMEEYEVTPAVKDDDGNVITEAVMGERSVPDMQGIDQAKLVPLLTSALQDAIAKIEQLESRITTLENK